MRLNLAGALTIVAVLVLWEIAVRGGIITFEYLPAPSAILVASWTLLRSGELAMQTLHTIGAVILGWVIASALGLALGLALGYSRTVRGWVEASLELLRPLPGIAFLPVALLIFNFSLETELAVMIYASVWPVLINTMGGIMNVAARLHDVARTLRLTPARTVTRLLIPAAAPSIIVGCRLGLGTALVMAIIAEMLGNPHGLGYAVVSELQAMQPERMFVYVLAIGFLALALNAALVAASHLMLRNRG
ncbi:MAG TPA: ABC transporter permease subunit [Stellaceae bacterium]|nr:ABC transporter permease subunit [Stellaceae bacterium]